MREIKLGSELTKRCVTYLRDLASGVEELTDWDMGICLNLHTFISKQKIWYDDWVAYTVVRELSHGWEHHSGDKDYPVPHESTVYIKLWENPLRLELCLYLADKLEACNGEFEVRKG